MLHVETAVSPGVLSRMCFGKRTTPKPSTRPSGALRNDCSIRLNHRSSPRWNFLQTAPAIMSANCIPTLRFEGWRNKLSIRFGYLEVNSLEECSSLSWCWRKRLSSLVPR
jgi:hypothetical protein